MSNLKPYHPDLDDDQRNVITRPSIDLKQRDNKEIEEIQANRVRKIGRPVWTIREFLSNGRISLRRKPAGNAPKIWTPPPPTSPGSKVVG